MEKNRCADDNALWEKRVEGTEDMMDMETLREENVTGILHVGAEETKVYRDMLLHFSAFMKCEGELKFENCLILYNESDTFGEITLAPGAKLTLKDTVVVCKGMNDSHFLKAEWENRIEIESSVFEDCSFFLSLNGNSSLIVRNCIMKNCFQKFIEMKLGAFAEYECNISDNKIIQDRLADFYRDPLSARPSVLIKINSLSVKPVVLININYTDICTHGKNNTCIFQRNIITEKEDFGISAGEKKNNDVKILYFSAEDAVVSDCTFVGLSGGIQASNIQSCSFQRCGKAFEVYHSVFSEGKPARIERCVFEECTDVLSLDDDANVSYCRFESCYDSIISSQGCDGGIMVEHCQFVNIKNNDISGLNALVFQKGCITFQRSKDPGSRENRLSECMFDGAELNMGYLISANCFEKPSGPVTFIKNCSFKNCVSKREDGEIIREYITYDTLFKKDQRFRANIISNCKGVDDTDIWSF